MMAGFFLQVSYVYCISMLNVPPEVSITHSLTLDSLRNSVHSKGLSFGPYKLRT